MQLYDLHIYLSRSIHSIDLRSLWWTVRGTCPHKGDKFMHHISLMEVASVGVTMHLVSLYRSKDRHPKVAKILCTLFLRAMEGPFGELSQVREKCHQKANWSFG